jgi:hypothetical protein
MTLDPGFMQGHFRLDPNAECDCRHTKGQNGQQIPQRNSHIEMDIGEQGREIGQIDNRHQLIPFNRSFKCSPRPVETLGTEIVIALESAPVSPEAVALKVQAPAAFSVRFDVVNTPEVAAPEVVPPSVMPVQVPPLFAMVMVSVAAVQTLLPESSTETETVPSTALISAFDG